MRYLSDKIGGWMPGSKTMTLDSQPGLFTIMDSIHATAAHGPQTRLPNEFYEEGVRKAIDRIVVHETFHGYSASRELRMLAVGQLMGDMVANMVDQVDWSHGHGGVDTASQSPPPPRLSLLGCHDHTIGAVLASLGCLDGDDSWPAFASHITLELFRRSSTPPPQARQHHSQFLSRSHSNNTDSTPPTPQGDTSETRGQPVKTLTTEQVQRLDEYFVRVSYNKRHLVIPGCREGGNHLDGNPSFCTLVN